MKGESKSRSQSLRLLSGYGPGMVETKVSLVTTRVPWLIMSSPINTSSPRGGVNSAAFTCWQRAVTGSLSGNTNDAHRVGADQGHTGGRLHGPYPDWFKLQPLRHFGRNAALGGAGVQQTFEPRYVLRRSRQFPPRVDTYSESGALLPVVSPAKPEHRRTSPGRWDGLLSPVWRNNHPGTASHLRLPPLRWY